MTKYKIMHTFMINTLIFTYNSRKILAHKEINNLMRSKGFIKIFHL